MESFYINLKIDKSYTKVLYDKYYSNEIFRLAFIFKNFDKFSDDDFNICIEALIDNFLPSCMIIYEFLEGFKQAKFNFQIETMGIKYDWDFDNKSKFISFMYDKWEKKILYVYSQLGALLIDYNKYYINRRKFFKKKYRKIQL